MDRAGLGRLISALQARGYSVVGPQVRDGAMVYDVLDSLGDLPVGWHDEQSPGRYRLEKTSDPAIFGCSVGPHSWKQFLHPPDIRLFHVDRDGQNLKILNNGTVAGAPKYALLGVRACELAAITIQDRVLGGDQIRRAGLHGAAQRRVRDRGPVYQCLGELLLRVHGHRPARRGGLRPGAH